MFNPDNNYEKFENKVWLSSPTMYSDSMRYVMEAYETNWKMISVKKSVVTL